MLSVRFASTDERVEFTINHYQDILRGSSSRKERTTGMLTSAKRAESRGGCCRNIAISLIEGLESENVYFPWKYPSDALVD
jgi:hypothetical protein